jgi:hypothetical protein
MEIPSEEEEKKTETSLSSNEIRQEAKASVFWIDSLLNKVAQNEKESTDSSDSDNESRPTH